MRSSPAPADAWDLRVYEAGHEETADMRSAVETFLRNCI